MVDSDGILCIGQSNASGAGHGDFVDRLESADNLIRQLGRYDPFNKQIIRVGRLVDGVPWDGLHFWKQDAFNDNHMGFSLPFARNYAKYSLASGRTAVILPCAHGATYIEQWNDTIVPPLDVRNASTTLYADMVDRVNFFLSLNPNNKLVAVLWHLGESNLNKVNAGTLTVAHFQEQLVAFFAALRQSFGSTYKFVTAKFCPSYIPSANKTAVENAIAAAAATDPRAVTVDTTGLHSNNDDLQDGDLPHFSAQSQVLLGARMYNAFTRLT